MRLKTLILPASFWMMSALCVLYSSQPCFARSLDIDQKPFYLPNTEINVSHYAVTLNVKELNSEVPIEASAVLTLTAKNNLPSLKLHSSKASIVLSSALVNGVGVTAQFINDYVLEINSPLNANGVYTVQLNYQITPEQLKSNRGLYYINGSFSVENWPYYTRRWIPSNDSPNDPATFEFKVAAPLGASVMAIGKMVSLKKYPNQNVSYWKMSKSIPSYGVNLVVGHFLKKEKTLCLNLQVANNATNQCNNSSIRIPLQLYLPASTAPETVASYWQGVQKDAQSVAFFSSILGAYPFEKVGFISVKQSFNMEYPSLIVGLGANVHEIAHHWFGDSVLIKHWGDFWISEGFTTYLDNLYQEVFAGTSDTMHATRQEIFNFKEATDPYSIFNQGPYVGGASSIHSLRTRLRAACEFPAKGEHDLHMTYAILRSVYQEFKGKKLGTWEWVHFLEKTLHTTLTTQANCFLSEEKVNSVLSEWSQDWYTQVH